MRDQQLFEYSKKIQLTDERELLSKVTIASSISKRLFRSFLKQRQSIGRLGFLGVYQNELVCFDSTSFKKTPHREIFRLTFSEITETKIKKRLSGFRNFYLIKTQRKKYKLYFRSKYSDLIMEINQVLIKG